ncbi:hypothetical protein [Streptomyces sp. NPDC005955]|uniref:hypothetical protein n=1 Tax=Streptomyces sp. NPDC005955 TaxID=3364738 RepID=UPI0036CEE82A
MAGPTLRTLLDTRHATDRILVPPAVDEVLTSLASTTPDPGPGVARLTLTAVASRELTLLGFAGLSLDPGLGPIAADVTVDGPAGAPAGFRIDLAPPNGVALPAELVPARVRVDGDRTTLVADPAGGRVRLTGAFVVRVEGRADGVAALRIVAPGSPDAVVTLTAEPTALLIGDTGFGLELPAGLVVDDSTTAAPPPAPSAPGPQPPSADPSWRGVALRGARLHLPGTTPLLGGAPLDVSFDLGNPVGLYGRAAVDLPATGSRPAVRVTTEWDDPAAGSLVDSLPTLIEAVVDLPVRGKTVAAGGDTVRILGGDPLRITGRFARDPRTSPPRMTFDLAATADGEEGLIGVTTDGNAGAAKTFVTAAALAVAFMADATPVGDGRGSTLDALLLAVGALGSTLTHSGELVVHGIEIEGALAGAADAGRALRLTVDYSVDVATEPIGIDGVLGIAIDPQGPMRVRYRGVGLEIAATGPLLDRFHLSYDRADFAVEDPGTWRITGPDSLFDVVGTRSGHGSVWFEVDLRFVLDLGPVKVSGATLRATSDGGTFAVTLRGLDARVDLPGLLSGSGTSGLNEHGVDVALAASLVPLQVGALAFASYEAADGFQKVLLGVAVDLPGPIPLANTGLGIYGLLGAFGINADIERPAATPGTDPVEALLAWQPWEKNAFPARRGSTAFGFGAVLGTVPDLGYAFSSKAVIALTVPDVALRAALEGAVLAERLTFAQLRTDAPAAPGIRLRGALAADAGGLTIGLRGSYEIPELLDVEVPFGAYFPTSGNGWYVHLGSDGVAGRGPGPVQAKVLKNLLDLGASAYLMVHGDGIPDLAGLGKDLDGFAFGFGLDWHTTSGFSVIRLDLSASAAVGLGSHPLMLIGHGGLSGALHLGPVSLGVRADVDLQVGPTDADRWAHFKVCGEVDLFFFSIGGCVELSVGKLSDTVPDPGVRPLDRVTLTDRTYTHTVEASTDPAKAPTVWPDCLPVLSFTTGPANALTGGPFLGALGGTAPGGWNGTTGGDGGYGSHDLRYAFGLSRLELIEVSGAGAGTPVPGPLLAAWQFPRHGSTTGTTALPGARELALLSWKPYHWMQTLPDGGAALPHDPIPGFADRCHLEWEASASWAPGARADRHGWGEPWRLTTEPAGLLRFASVFAVTVTAQFGRLPLDEFTVHDQDLPLSFDLGGPIGYGAPVPAADRAFDGGLALPRVTAAGYTGPGGPFEQVLNEQRIVVDLLIDEDRGLHNPLVALVADPAVDGPVTDRLTVIGHTPDGTAVEWTAPATEWTGDGRQTLTYGAGREWSRVQVAYDPRLRIDLLGVYGLTPTASDDAFTAGYAAASASDGLEALAAAPLGAQQNLLKPGTLYQLVVGQTASGDRPGGAHADFPETTTAYYFRTTPKPTGGPGAAQAARLLARRLVLQDRDTFDPAYLERYLLGYTPLDKAAAWFRADPVAVHFAVEYIGQFALLYGRDVRLRYRRTDPPPEQPRPWKVLTIAEAGGPLAAVHRTGAVERRIITGGEALPAVTRCPLPPIGASIVGTTPPLEPSATYELAVTFPLPNLPESGNQLPGVVFTTSRWSTPRELLAELGFADVAGAPSGDVRVVSGHGLAPGEVLADGAVDQALDELGLLRWPLPDRARTSALWSRETTTGPWLLTGVLVEAAEPVSRPATTTLAGDVTRLALGELTTSGGAFPVVRRTTSGTRHLYLSTVPFAPTDALVLHGSEQSVSLGGPPPAPVPFALRCAVGAAPRFAEDL